MTSQIETIVNAYKTLSKIPSVVGGKLNRAGNRVTAKWSVRNLDKGKTTKYLREYFLDKDFKVVAENDFGVDVSNEILAAVSPQERFKAVIREERDGKDSKKQYLEVWTKQGLAHSIDLTALDIHGDVYADSEFGSLDWSQDETSVVYVAERKLKKSEGYIKRKPEDKPGDGSGEDKPKKGEEFIYRQDWGEQLVGKHLSVIVVCRLTTETFTVLQGLPDTCCPGQVGFLRDETGVFGVAWDTEPQRLGLIFCTNRPSYIFTLTFDGKMNKLTEEGAAVRGVRERRGTLAWLQRDAGGPHHAAHRLMIHQHGETKTIVDIVQTEKQISNGTFYGIYSQGLPKNCFANGSRLVFSTPQQSEIRSYVLDSNSGRMVDISRKGPTSTCVLDVCDDVILVACSSMNSPARLYVARLPSVGSEENIEWVAVSEPVALPNEVAQATVEYLDICHDTTEPVRSFTALYSAPKMEGKLPLIVWPHGGPHSNFVNAFSLEAALFHLLGFACLRVNYRGSTGQGEACVRSLIAHVGDYDVADCYLALTRTREQNTRCVLYGGSYGGLVVAHLAGRYPDMFDAMVMRNPLIDLAVKGHYADNFDGCAIEGGFQFTEQGPVSEAELVALRRCSPLTHVHKVKAPTAMMLGSGDKRVPLFQGLEYARRLKANGVPTRVYMYEDNHSLSSLPAEIDNLVNSADWFLTHINGAQG